MGRMQRKLTLLLHITNKPKLRPLRRKLLLHRRSEIGKRRTRQSYNKTNVTLHYQELHREANVVSLRSAHVIDSGGLVVLVLNAADLSARIPKGRKWWGPQDFGWVENDLAWLYRHPRSQADELELSKSIDFVSKHTKVRSFQTPPKFRLLWADSGNSVAVYVNGEPWAFIDEQTRRGYSKGIADDAIGKQWDEAKFVNIFGPIRRD
jgi:hypothetical protein